MPAREANDPTPVSLYDTEERLVAGTICERTLIEGGCSTSCSCVVRANLPLIEVLEQTGEIRFFRKDTGIGPTKISGLFPLTLEKGKFFSSDSRDIDPHTNSSPDFADENA